MTISSADIATGCIAGFSAAGVVLRPFHWPEAIWAVAGAVLLVVCGLLPTGAALAAVGRGGDVYLFLTGMMLLSEIARREGVFDWVAALAVRAARGSASRLFVLVYGLGVVVTAILSNDATAVVLTPAVFAATKKAQVDPLPYLFVCALVANAASFVLPISNPANLVVYGGHMPALATWLARFALPSLVAILATFLALRFAERRAVAGRCAEEAEMPALSRAGTRVLAGISGTAAVLLVASMFDIPLGLPTAIMGAVLTAIVLLPRRQAPWPLLNAVSWAVLPLVAGLFVLVEGVARTGAISRLALVLKAGASSSPAMAAGFGGGLIAIVTNLMNNLPAGLIASATIAQAHTPSAVTDSILIGVDLGPNLSVTGSLATILWLTAIRREGESVGFWRFLKLGTIAMPPALALAIVARIATG